MPLNLDTLESWLWESANILRGSIDSSDFKNYIFGLLFLKRFNDVFEERVRQLEQDEKLSEKEAAVEVQAKWGIFPPNARWPNLIARTENIGEALDKAFADIEANNTELQHVLTATQYGGMDHSMRDKSAAPENMKVGPGVDMIAPMPADRTGEPGLGLENVDHRVLTYRDLVSLKPNPDTRAPSRSLEIHLAGNMERFMWSFDGRSLKEVKEPIRFERNERVRVTLVNDTMMQHPIHLHGHFFGLVHAPVGYLPRKHTVNVLPGGKVTFDVTAEEGDWAFHCHMLYHMHGGMFQVFKVRKAEGGVS